MAQGRLEGLFLWGASYLPRSGACAEADSSGHLGGGLLRSQEPEKRTIIRPSTKAGHFLKVASCLMQCQGRLILAPLAGGTTAPPHFGEGANGASSRGAASRGAISDPTSSGLGTSPGRIRLRTGSSEWAVS